MKAISLLLAALPSIALGLPSQADRDSFDPYDYHKTFVECPAFERSNGTEARKITLRLNYLDVNPHGKKVLILLHGWPSLWTTYRHQITHFERAGYRMIIPEHRGYGDSQHPRDLENSNSFNDFVDDIVCMLNHAKVKKGVCVGNDFGAQVCWAAGRARPDRFSAVFNVGIPYVSASTPFRTTRELAALNPSFSYQVYLSSDPKGAAAEMNADPRSAIRSCAQVADSILPKEFLKKNNTFLGPWREFIRDRGLKEIPVSGIMSKRVEDYMVESYKKQGFYNTYNGYPDGNRKRAHDFEVAQGNFTLSQPTFTLFPTRDPVSDWAALSKQVKEDSFLTNHQTASMATAHWPHEEKPDEFNKILGQWLERIQVWT